MTFDDLGTLRDYFPAIADVALFLLGVGIVVYAFTKKSVGERKPFSMNNPKLGKIEMDFVAFVMLLGILVAGSGAFFRYRNYETRVRELEGNQTTTEAQVKALQTQMERFKDYSLNVALTFDESIDSQAAVVQARVRKPGESEWVLLDSVSRAPETEAGNLLQVKVSNLNPGDNLRFRVLHDGRSWTSTPIEVPIFAVKMVEAPR